MIVTPNMASEWLKLNVHNRSVRRSHVGFLADEMLNGRWLLNHQGIALNHDKLIDGQHRLLAIVQSGKSVPMLVTTEMDINTQDTLDIGTKRSIADQLHLNDGLNNAIMKSSACRTVAIICAGTKVKMSIGTTRLILSEMETELELVTSLADKFIPGKRSWIIGSLAFALHADNDCLGFVEGFYTGENLPSKSPAKAARDWVTNRIGYILGGSDPIPKCQAICNAVKNYVVGIDQTTIKTGVSGLDYFIAKKKKLVAQIRAEFHEQIIRDRNSKTLPEN